tara:strand:- start:714 stop:962 length:249 start_codon:yes stop_codon:yes gene_type:complete
MVQNEKEYNMVKERQSEDVVIITLTKKVRKCDICSAIKKEKEIRVVKYPRIDKYFGRVIADKKVCNECYDDVKLILDNLNYN